MMKVKKFNGKTRTNTKSQAQILKEVLRDEQLEQKRIRRRTEYLRNAGKVKTIDGVKWKFLLNPENDKIIMVSEDGRLAKYTKWLKHDTLETYYTQLSNRGYLMCYQEVFKTDLIHRVVALAWVLNKDEKETVDHIDADKTNNHKDNLQWMSRKENQKKALYKDDKIIGKKMKPIKLTKGTTERVFNSMNEAARFLGCNIGTVSNCLNPKQSAKTAYGWRVESV